MLNDSQSNQTDNSRGLLSGLVRFLSDILKDVAASLLVVTLTFLFATAVTAACFGITNGHCSSRPSEVS